MQTVQLLTIHSSSLFFFVLILFRLFQTCSLVTACLPTPLHEPRTVLPPTMTASLLARILNTLARASGDVTHALCPLEVAILPSRVIAYLHEHVCVQCTRPAMCDSQTYCSPQGLSTQIHAMCDSETCWDLQGLCDPRTVGVM